MKRAQKLLYRGEIITGKRIESGHSYAQVQHQSARMSKITNGGRTQLTTTFVGDQLTVGCQICWTHAGQ